MCKEEGVVNSVFYALSCAKYCFLYDIAFVYFVLNQLFICLCVSV